MSTPDKRWIFHDLDASGHYKLMSYTVHASANSNMQRTKHQPSRQTQWGALVVLVDCSRWDSPKQARLLPTEIVTDILAAFVLTLTLTSHFCFLRLVCRMAIETIGNLRYTVETDYWSYGVLLWELFTVLNKDYPHAKVLPYDGIPNDEVC